VNRILLTKFKKIIVYYIFIKLTSIVKDSPTLLSHDEIAVFIHELGHIFHHLLNDSKWAVFKSSDVQSDFVETPALMVYIINSKLYMFLLLN